MAVNADKPHLWKADIAHSIDFYNDWFMQFAPQTYRDTRAETTKQVTDALQLTANLTRIAPEVLRENPTVLPILRMTTAPPIARDRLIGLARVAPGLVKSMEVEQRIPPRMLQSNIDADLRRIGEIIANLTDRDLFPWLEHNQQSTEMAVQRAATVVADRLCGAVADPVIRNAQERRQLVTIQQWLEQRGYALVKAGEGVAAFEMQPGTFAFRLNIPVKLTGGTRKINIPIDAVVMPVRAQAGELPLLIEAKSAGDFTNTNKRRKEEAVKITQLRNNYGEDVRLVLFLCGYFDSGYLGYEAAEGIDWVWEHRTDDLAAFGL